MSGVQTGVPLAPQPSPGVSNPLHAPGIMATTSVGSFARHWCPAILDRPQTPPSRPTTASDGDHPASRRVAERLRAGPFHDRIGVRPPLPYRGFRAAAGRSGFSGGSGAFCIGGLAGRRTFSEGCPVGWSPEAAFPRPRTARFSPNERRSHRDTRGFTDPIYPSHHDPVKVATAIPAEARSWTRLVPRLRRVASEPQKGRRSRGKAASGGRPRVAGAG
jgi:hypothetical protein